MDQIEKAIIYVGSYFLLFIAAVSLEIMSDLPTFYDVLVYISCIYIIWARDEILAYHVIGSNVVCHGGKFKRFLSSMLRIILGLIIVKMLILGFYQSVLVLFLIDYLTWVWTGKALSHAMTLCTIERKVNESKV